MTVRKVLPTCPICHNTSVVEVGTVEYTQEVLEFTVSAMGKIIDTEWGDRDVGYDDTVTEYRCNDSDCGYSGPKSSFVPKVGKVTPGVQGDDPAQTLT